MPLGQIIPNRYRPSKLEVAESRERFERDFRDYSQRFKEIFFPGSFLDYHRGSVAEKIQTLP